MKVETLRCVAGSPPTVIAGKDWRIFISSLVLGSQFGGGDDTAEREGEVNFSCGEAGI